MPYRVKQRKEDRQEIEAAIAAVRRKEYLARKRLSKADIIEGDDSFLYVECESHDAAVEVLLAGKGGFGIAEYDTPRGNIVEVYPHPTCRQIAGGVGVFLDPFDQQAFIIRETEEKAWAAAWELLQNLPDY